MKKILIIITTLLLHIACSQSPDEPDYILSFIKYDSSNTFPFIRYDKNYLQWKDFSAIQHFFIKLKNSKNNKVRILHIGDSHVQAGTYPGEARYKLQQVFGYGGFGFLFPYKMIKTHPPYDYETYYKCRNYIWSKNLHKEPKIPLGVLGASVKIYDPNTSMTFLFNSNAIIKEHYTKLKILCDKDSATYNWQIIVNNHDTVNVENFSEFSLLNFTEVYLPASPNKKLVIKTKKSKDYQKYATFYGAILESYKYEGILYTSAGINGAGFRSILRQKRMEQDIKDINPDLIIIDLGANDYYFGTIDTNSYKKNLQEIINIVKKAAPRASIIISCSHDLIKYGYYSIKETQTAMKIAKQLAFKNNCAFYNWFEVSGGKGSMKLLHLYNLAKHDMIHLTHKGYKLKSELFANAILYSYYLFLKGIYNIPDTIKAPTPKNWKYDTSKIVKIVKNKSRPIIYKVRYGDNLSTIAQRFGVRYKDIMRWNNLRSTKIYAGQRLKIYPKKTGYKYNTQRKLTNNSQPKTKGKVKYYTIKKGDSLWSVAHKFNVSVPQLKKWNNLKSDKIYPGKKLKIIIN